MNLRLKTTILLSGVVIVFLSASWWSINGIVERSLKQSILKSAESISNYSAATISQFISDKLRKTKAVAEGLHPEKLRNNEVPQIEADLKKMMMIFPGFENGAFILKPNGDLWVDYPPHPEIRGQSFAHREYFQNTLSANHGIAGKPYFSARTKAPVLTFTEILRDPLGEIIGILGCSTQLNATTSLGSIAKQKFGNSGYIYVFSRERQMILHPDETRILKFDVPKGANTLFDAAIEGFEGVGETVNSRNIPMLLATKSVPNTNWIVGVQQPLTEALAPLQETQRLMLLALVLGGIFSAFIGLLWINRIVSPLTLLNEAVYWLGIPSDQIHPDFQKSSVDPRKKLVEVANSRDEVGSLATAFLKMDERLKNLVGTLSSVAHEWEKTFDTVEDAIFLVDKDMSISRLNLAAAKLFDLSFQECIGKNLNSLLFGDQISKGIKLPILPDDTPHSFQIESSDLVKEGDFEISGTCIINDEGQTTGAIYTLRDVTTRKSLEKNISENSKMNALGTMAGGIAHDFNNILCAITGYAEVLRIKVGEDKKQQHCIQEIKKASERGAGLVRSLMTYSREKVQEVALIDLNSLLLDLKDMINRLTDENVVVHWDLCNKSLLFEGQKGKIEQVIINLLVNAKDAMPEGGDIYITTTHKPAGELEKGEGLPQIILTIKDAGDGMSKEVAEKIFDPFFTTKPLGKGTGLGLSIVQGIIRAHNGKISVDSVLGLGTTFSITLPATQKLKKVIMEKNESESLSVSDEIQKNVHILLVDDDTSVIEVNKAILEEYGWQVTSVDDSIKAIKLFEENNKFNLLITDVIMPNINGRELATKLREKSPDLKVLYLTGYSSDILQSKGIKTEDLMILEKPFSPQELHKTIKLIFQEVFESHIS